MRRYEGTWHTETKLLFPSYVFVESENRTLLLEELKEGGMEALLCIEQAEEMFLRDLYGDSRHLMMSKGIVKGGFPQVTAGPLRGMEHKICRIDRHKRLANNYAAGKFIWIYDCKFCPYVCNRQLYCNI